MLSPSPAAFLQLIDSMATVLTQAAQASRERLASLGSPALAAMLDNDALVTQAELQRRALGVFRAQRAALAPHRRPDFTPALRLEIVQVARFRGWNAVQAADYFVLHPNTVRAWFAEAQGRRDPNLAGRLTPAVDTCRLDDTVRIAVHQLRTVCPQPEFGSRTLARHLIHTGIDLSRSSVQRILREQPPLPGAPPEVQDVPVGSPVPKKAQPPMQEPTGGPTFGVLRPRKPNAVWHIDLLKFKVLWLSFWIAAIVDGHSRKILALRAFPRVPRSHHVLALVRGAVAEFGKPAVVLTDRGGQFRKLFRTGLAQMSIEHIQGPPRSPFFNGKIERMWRTLRLWERLTCWLPMGLGRLQDRLDAFRQWHNEYRPHMALGCRTPDEAWAGITPPAPMRFRAADSTKPIITIRRLRCRGDPNLPIIDITVRLPAAA